jgi:hypothetical protein
MVFSLPTAITELRLLGPCAGPFLVRYLLFFFSQAAISSLNCGFRMQSR